MCLMKLIEARDQYTFANVWIQEGKKMFKDDNKIDLNLWIQSYIGLLIWKEKLRLLFYFLFRILYETFCGYLTKHMFFNLTIENAPLTNKKMEILLVNVLLFQIQFLSYKTFINILITARKFYFARLLFMTLIYNFIINLYNVL